MTSRAKKLNEYQMATANLKRVLRDRRLTYREIAQGIGLSESGVKKIFSARDGSFQRLSQICRYAGVSIAEVIEDRRTRDVEFSEAQQKEFLKDSTLFHFYWLLVYERRSLAQVHDELLLSRSEGFRLARKLDMLGLIKLLPHDRIRLPSIKAVRWHGDGEFMRVLYKKWSRALVEELATPERTEDEFFLLRYLQMTKGTFAEFILAQRALEEEFVRRSIQEMRSRPPGLGHVRWLAVADKRSFVTGKVLDDA